MGKAERFIRFIDRLQSRIYVFIASILLLGTLLVGAVAVAWQTSRQVDDLRVAYSRTASMLRASNDVRLASLNLLRGERGYLLTGNPDYLEPFASGKTLMADALDLLSTESVRDPKLEAETTALRGETTSYVARLETIVALNQQGNHAAAMTMVRADDGRAAIKRIDASLDKIISRERRELDALELRVRQAIDRQEFLLAIIAAAGLCLIVLASLTVIALRRSFARERAYREELRCLAQTDELTGLTNRREFTASLERAIAASRRDNKPLAVALLGIDHFKRVNDIHGHPAGDEVIRKVARIALAAVRSCDIVGRIGGEEFALVLPGAGIAQAYAVCERLRQHVQDEPIELPSGETISVSISTGIARLIRIDTQEALLERADKALYAAKHGGRDQVRLAA